MFAAIVTRSQIAQATKFRFVRSRTDEPVAGRQPLVEHLVGIVRYPPGLAHAPHPSSRSLNWAMREWSTSSPTSAPGLAHLSRTSPTDWWHDRSRMGKGAR